MKYPVDIKTQGVLDLAAAFRKPFKPSPGADRKNYNQDPSSYDPTVTNRPAPTGPIQDDQ